MLCSTLTRVTPPAQAETQPLRFIACAGALPWPAQATAFYTECCPRDASWEVNLSTSKGIRLTLFGRPALESADGDVSLSPMQWALVAFVYGDPTRRDGRDAIARFLWSGDADAAARRRLSQLLYEVEQRTGQAMFLKPGSSIRPNPEAVVSDLDDFYASIGSEDLGTAAQLVARGFLIGIPEIPTTAFDRWLDERSAVLRADLRKRATERWVRAEDEALWNQRTRDAAEALLYLDPGSEAALRRSMWAQAMSGAPLQAIATLEGFVEVSGMKGDEDLQEETRTLLERIRALARHRRGKQIERPGPSRADPTLFGREGEVASLLPIVAGSINDGITVVAVAGEAGLGKTRLIRECLEPAMLRGRLIMQTMLPELERDIPLNALIEAMSTQDIARALLALDEPWRSVILNLMPGFAKVVGEPGALPYVQPASLQRRLLESVRLLMDEVVKEQPVLMFIDDFHWADDSSLAALSYMRRRWSVGSLVLVVAYRPEYVVPGSAVASFLEADSVKHVELGPIGEVARKRLIKEAAGGEVPDDVADGLRELGGGNPLFLIELARQWSEGELEFPRREIDPIRLSGSIQQLFERRLEGLGSEATRVLEALSVLAKRVPMKVLRNVSGLDERQVTDGLEPLDKAGLLRWATDGVEVWHGLVRQAVLGRTS
ncbi:MAG: DNA-binding SARP family transcriptional activator, partial [Myxococcota bacterium]